MLCVKSHGGHCCGISHIYGFGRHTADTLDRLDKVLKRARTGILYEVALTDNQMMSWASELEKRGFKLGPRFRNSNSGNFVTVLFFCKSRARKAPPYTWGKKTEEFTKKQEK